MAISVIRSLRLLPPVVSMSMMANRVLPIWKFENVLIWKWGVNLSTPYCKNLSTKYGFWEVWRNGGWIKVIVIIETNYLPLALVTHNDTMILSFGDKDTEQVWKGNWVKRLPNEVQEIGRRKLRMLNSSQNIQDLRIPPSNRLEKLKGDMKEFYSIRINDQWRVVFKWEDGNSSEVSIVDYH